MDEKAVSVDNVETLYPMFFGVSCAYFALKLLPESEICNSDHKLLRGSAHLLGLLIWMIQRESQIGRTELLQKLENAHKVIDELSKRRSEEAKANEKVARIIASREQTWFDERKRLSQQITVLSKTLGIQAAKREEMASQLSEKLKAKERLLEEEVKKRLEIEERAKKAEEEIDELREAAKQHSVEIAKHKAAFFELVSNQRQLESDLGRALKQGQTTKEELDAALQQKEQSVLIVQRVSMELAKARQELEQKDQILSAMLRKSRLDTAEREVLLEEMRLSKARRNQAEMETARWRAISESKNERHLLRNMLSKRANRTSDVLPGVKDELIENGADTRHKREIDELKDQLRIKDWRLSSMEVESKKLQSHIQRADRDMAQLQQEHVRLKASLLDREMELRSLGQRLQMPEDPHRLNSSQAWSNVKIVKRKPEIERHEMETIPEETSPAVENQKADGSPVIIDQKEMTIVRQESVESDNNRNTETSSASTSQASSSTWKMDIRALGILYKIKRLKQQLVLLERLAGKQESCENSEGSNDHPGTKGFYALTSLLTKQVDRYQSLQGKTDDLCQRMHDSSLNLNKKDSTTMRTADATRKLGQFLEETFQLQRYVVATGQKLVEVQGRIASEFVRDCEKMEKLENLDVKRFGDGIGALLREVQRGVEVRISRMIGDLEGTMAFDGMVHFRK